MPRQPAPDLGPGPYLTLPIVGAYYRPPAQIVLNHLASDTPLILCAEPDNQADPNAVAVWLVTENLPASAHEALDTYLPNCGLTLDEFLQTEQWHLGYIPKEIAKRLRETSTIPTDAVVEVKFCVVNGKPNVRFEYPVL